MKKTSWKRTAAGLLSVFLVCGTAASAAADRADGSAADFVAQLASGGEGTLTEVPVTGAGVQPVQVCAGSDYAQEWSDEADQPLAKSEWTVLALGTDSEAQYPALAASLAEINRAKKEESEARHSEMKEEAKEMLRENPDFFGSFLNEESAFVQRADSHLVSVLFTFSTYTGGVHGYYGYRGLTLDTETGATLALSDLVTDTAAFAEEVREVVTAEWPGTDAELVDGYFAETAPDDYIWTAGCEGITCYFNPYTLGAYAIGAQKVEIPYEGHEGLFSEKAVEAQTSYGVEFPQGETMRIGDREVAVRGNADEYGDYESLTITYNGAETTFDDIWGYGIHPTWMHLPEADYLYLDLPEDNDYHLLQVYRLGEEVEKVGEEALGNDYVTNESGDMWVYADAALTDPQQMPMCVRTYLLSTSDGSRMYRVGSDGMPEPLEEYFTIRYPHTLTLKEELAASEVDAESGEVTGTVTLPAGAELTMLRTDNESFVDLLYDQKKYVRLYVDAGDWPQTVDGRDIEELFEGTFFAG